MGAVLLVAVLGTPSQAHAARPITKPAADVASAVAPPFEVAVWTDRILSYLKGLFQLLGGNPNDFNGATPQAAMAAVYEQFEENGIADLTELEVIDAIAITAQLDAALAAPPASIDPGDFAQLKVIEAALYAAK